jgi:hypothetical protein
MEDRWLYLVKGRARGRWRAREREGSRRASWKVRIGSCTWSRGGRGVGGGRGRASWKVRTDGCTWSKGGRGVGGERGRGRGAGEPVGR